MKTVRLIISFAVLTLGLPTADFPALYAMPMNSDHQQSEEFSHSEEETHPAAEDVEITLSKPSIPLPKTTGPWTRPDEPKIVTPKAIFNYMNGAGELYVGYRFEFIEIYEYTSEKQDNILVELYWMESADDAYGLLSTDWYGNATELGKEKLPKKEKDPYPRALYESGLLRMWSGRYYARITAYLETEESKKAVFDIGRVVAASQPSPSPPEVIKIMPLELTSGWELRKDRMCFLRSHLVLNSQYYLSSKNILKLDLSAQAVIAAYEKKDDTRNKIYLLLVQYDNAKKAREGLRTFHEAYFTEYKVSYPLTEKEPYVFQIEDGWSGYIVEEDHAVLIFQCPDRSVLKTMLTNMRNKIHIEESVNE